MPIVATNPPAAHPSPWGEFFRGATRPSLAGVIGVLLVTSLLIFAAVTVITPATLARSPGYIAEDAKDEYVFLTAHAMRMMQAPAPPLSVILIGDSSLREAISSPTELENLLAARVGKPVKVDLLAAGGLTEWDVIVLAGAIPANTHGVLAIEMAPYHLAQPRLKLEEAEASRVMIDSRVLRKTREHSGMAQKSGTGIYLVDHRDFYFARVKSFWHLFTGPVQPQQHLLENAATWTDDDWEQQGKRVVDWEGKYTRSKAGNLLVYERMLKRLDNVPDLEVALLQSVENPRVAWQWTKPAHTAVRQEFRKDLEEFAERNDVALWNIGPEVNLRPEEFVDYTHLRSPDARRRFTEALARHLAELLKSEN